MIRDRFERTQWRVPGAKPVPGYLIRCSKCGATDKVGMVTYGGAMQSEAIAQRFRNRGWLVGSRDGKDLCPACAGLKKKSDRCAESAVSTAGVEVEVKREAVIKFLDKQKRPLSLQEITQQTGAPYDPLRKMVSVLSREGEILRSSYGYYVSPKNRHLIVGVDAQQQEVKMENVNTESAVTEEAAAAREMTREDRRLIFAKLHEVYLDETRGYSSGWSDVKVGSDLGVAVDWVKSIREENFGVEHASDETRELVARIESALEESKRAREEYFAEIRSLHEKLSEASSLYNAVRDAAAGVQSRIDASERELDKLRGAIGL